MSAQAKKRTIIIVIVAVLLIAAFLVCWKIWSPKANEGDKSITVVVTHGDGSEKTFPISTNAETLWDALDENDLVKGEPSEYGMFITEVDGEVANGEGGKYWLFTKDGEWVETGSESTYIADADHYEFFIYAS